MRKSFVFVLFLFFSSVHYSASALWYTRLSDSTVKVVYNTSYDTTSNWHVNIPNTVYMKFSTDNVYRNYKVISIADDAFKNCTNIHSVSIGNNVSTIGSQAFYGCSGLELLVIGENVSTIGNSAFYGCNNIKRLYYNARNCASASGYDATYSQYYYFSHFHGHMDHLIIGDSVQIIPQEAFDGCSADTLTIGTNVISIGTQAFLGWYNTQVLYYNAKNCANAIGNNYFQLSLNKLIIGEAVVSIPHSAFSGFSSLDGKLVVPNSVTTIGNSAFQGCSNIDSLVFGENLCTIGNNAFSGCSSLDGKIIIPNSVTTIGSSAFYNCSNIKSLELGYNLCMIGDNAFNGCASLDGTLTIPSNVTTIGSSAFSGCSGFEGALTIPNSVTTIGQYAFYNCSGMDTLYIGTNVSTIGGYAFQGCTGIAYIYYNAKNCTTQLSYGNSSPFSGTIQNSLQTLIIGDSVQSIPSYAFYHCTGLNGTLTIPNSVITIGSSAFSGCTGLEGKLIISDSIETIGSWAFYNCSGIDTLILGGNLLSISVGAFAGCTNIKGSLVIPYWVNTIGESAFRYCNHIDSLIIGKNVSSIGNYAFHGCTSVRYIYYNAINCVTGLCRNNESPFSGSVQNNLQSLIVGDDVVTIPGDAFRNCNQLKSITLSKNITTIGYGAFSGCSNIDKLCWNVSNAVSLNSNQYPFANSYIKKVIVGDTIGISARIFEGVLGLDTVVWNAQSVTVFNTLGTVSPFTDKLKNVIITENAKVIPNNCFLNCVDLNSIVWNARTITSYPTNNTMHPFVGCSNLHIVIFGDSVQSIPARAFRGCSSITSVSMGNSIKSIGLYAFYGCTQINSNILLDSLSYLGAGAFYDCQNIAGNINLSKLSTISSSTFYNCQNLTFSHFDSLTTLGSYSFYNCNNISGNLNISQVNTIPQYSFYACDNITSIQFSPSLNSIGKKAFYNCDNLLSIDLDSAQVTLGDSAFADCDRLVTANIGNTTSIGVGTFAGCFRLTTVNMGNMVMIISNNAFRDCVRLTSPKLSNALVTIGDNAFKGCPLITGQLNLPENVTFIGDGAYSGCSGITSIMAKPQNPPTIFATTFDSVSTSIPVYVPCGRVTNYFVTDYWENFTNIVEMEPYQVNLSVNNDAMGSVAITSPPTCGTPQAIIAATSNTGFHFIYWSDGNTNNPRVVSLNQDTSLVAYFTINQAYITVHSNDTVKGHVSGSGLYVYNAPVVLMATANEGYHFIHWNDGNTQNPRYITATTDSVFTAIFVSNLSNINVLNNNPEMGTVSGSGVYYYQNYATLSATPNYGYHFTHWNDGNTDNPRMLFVDRDTSFTASFALNVYAISASSENSSMGSVTGGGNYTYNMQISLSATANYGYHFSQWNDGNTQNPRTITVTKDSSFTAQFAANIYTLTVSSNDPEMGTAYGAGTFTFNSQTTISAAPNYGYHFTQWSDGNTDNPRMVTINENHEYIAMFAINFYTITVNSSNPALGSAFGGGSYNYNSSITITATPNYGYHFTQWSDGNTQNPRTVTVMQNATYTAQFAINSYAVTVNSNSDNMGTVIGSGSYIYNTPATISATPNYGYHFVQWNDGSTENPRTIIVTQDGVYTAQFDYNTYTLTALSNNYLAGNVIGGGTYNYLTVVSVNAVPNEHYHFVQWSDSTTDNPRNITMIKDTMLTAEFAIDQHSVNVQSANSTMGSATGGGSFAYGTTIHLTATPNYGYHFVQWSDGDTQNPRTMIVGQDVTITAVFDYNQYVANIQSSDTSKGTVNGLGTYSYLTLVTIQALPVMGYHFTQWSDGSTENPRTLTLTQDTLIVAQFSINMHIVDVQANDAAMGSVTGAGTYPYQTTITVSANAADHHHFVQWDDGNTSNPRQIQVLSDITLMAIFAEDDKFVINALCSDTTMGQVYGGGEYYAGMQATLTAVPNNHYQFEHWIDGVTANPRTITVLESATYVAVFTPVSYDILAYSSNEMWGTVNGTGSYPYHSTVTLEAIANEGYHFVCWNDGDSSAVRTIQVEGNAVYFATFAEGVGIEEHQQQRDISIYPNPTTDVLYIDANDIRTIEIFNMYGQLLAQIEGGNKVDMSSFDSGTYIIRITLLDGIIEKKVVKI